MARVLAASDGADHHGRLALKALMLDPGPIEVAVARVPPGMALRTHRDGQVLTQDPQPWTSWAVVPGTALGWGAWCTSWFYPGGIRNGRHTRDRHVWQQAARLVCRRLPGPAVAYVVHKQAEDHGRPVWQAIEIREEG
jgi:hypothetical protein